MGHSHSLQNNINPTILIASFIKISALLKSTYKNLWFYVQLCTVITVDSDKLLVYLWLFLTIISDIGSCNIIINSLSILVCRYAPGTLIVDTYNFSYDYMVSV